MNLFSKGWGGPPSSSSVLGNVQLTLLSPTAIACTPTAQGQYVTFADAGNLVPQTLLSIKNNSAYYLGLKDGAGNQLGWVRPFDTATAALIDNTTQAGIWAVSNVSKMGITAQYSNIGTTAFFSGSTTPILQTVAIDATRTLILYTAGTYTTCTLWGQVYDSSQPAGSQFGSVTSIAAGVFSAIAIAQGAAQVLLCRINNTIVLTAQVLSFTGTTINLNAGGIATKTIGSGGTFIFGNIVLAGSTYCVCYARPSTTAGVVAMTVSGTTVTMGSEATVASASTVGTAYQRPLLFVSGTTKIRLVTQGTTTTGVVKPYTISAGTTLTAGTLANWTHVASQDYRVVQASNGDLFIFYYSTSSALNCAVSSLSGTVETIATCAIDAVTDSGGAKTWDVVAVSSSAVGVGYINSNIEQLNFNIITDSAGTPTAGTVASSNTFNTGTNIYFAALPLVGTTASIALYANDATSWVQSLVASFNCSAASPTLASTTYSNAYNNAGLAAVVPPKPVQSDVFGNRQGNSLVAGGALYTINGNTLGVTATKFSQQEIRHVNEFNNLGININSAASFLAGQAVGAAANDSWFATPFITGSTGILLTKVEAVA